MSNHWTKEELEMLDKLSAEAVAQITGRSVQAVKSKATRLKQERAPLKAWERVCPICGKVYHMTSEEWVYKAYVNGHMKKVCSWHCMRGRKR